MGRRTMTDPVVVPLTTLTDVCLRARRHYLGQTAAERWEVHTSIPFANREADLDGWLHVSNLADEWLGVSYRILWQPATDNMRLVSLRG